MTNKPVSKGHSYVCRSCALRRIFLGSLIDHIRDVHQRKVSAPEYQPITERQAVALTVMLRKQP
jgi:hypothetical protein